MPRRRDKPGSARRLVIPITVGIVGAVIGVNVLMMTQVSSSEQYVTELQEISDQSVALTQNYEDAFERWEQGEISDAEMLEITGRDLEQRGALLSRLESLEPPDRFKEGHEMTVLSLEYELESNKHAQRYIETGDQAEYEKSSDLLQLAFDYESKAFQAFAEANKNT